MRPARKGDGTGLSFPGYSEVRKGDGTKLWSAGADIPDSVVNQLVPSGSDQWTDNIGSIDTTAYGSPSVIEGGLNGEDYIEYDGASRHEDLNYLIEQHNVWVVVAKHETAEFGYLYGDVDTQLSSRNVDGDFRTFAGTNIVTSQYNTNWNIHAMSFNGTSSYYRINGVEEASGDAGTQDMDGLSIGGQKGGGEELVGAIAEVVALDSPGLSDVESEEQRMSDKYNIPLA